MKRKMNFRKLEFTDYTIAQEPTSTANNRKLYKAKKNGVDFHIWKIALSALTM